MSKLIGVCAEVDAESLKHEIEKAKKQLALSYQIHRSLENLEVQNTNERIDRLLSQYYRLYKKELLAQSDTKATKLVNLA